MLLFFLFLLDSKAYFEPNHDTLPIILEEFDKATTSIHLQAYGFTDDRIIESLIKARKRDVHISLTLDHSNLHHPSAQKCLNNGIDVKIDKNHPIAHAKFAIIDDKILIHGSRNWTYASQKNWEAIIITDDKSLIDSFEANWQSHREHCINYQ